MTNKHPSSDAQHRIGSTVTMALLWFVVFSLPGIAVAEVEHFDVDPNTGFSAATVLDSGDQICTSQLFPIDADDRLVGEGDVAAQTAALVEQLKVVLKANYSSLASLLKINVYLQSEANRPAVQMALKTHLANGHPAVSYVVSKLPHPQALVAIDAVAAVEMSARPSDAIKLVVRSQLKNTHQDKRFANASRFPAGRIIYISGQAEPGDLAEATKKTVQELHRTLEWLGLDQSHVVQLKAFLKPMSEVATVRDEISALYPQGPAPPVSYVEWTNDSPIEIELVAWAPAEKCEANATFHSPPWMKTSPVFSRVAIAEAGKQIYISGLYGQSQASGEAQVRHIFSRLQKILRNTHSDLKHMVKATYYVSSDEASDKLNQIRPELYDPASPPAASKAGVAGCGQKGCTITIDIIAVSTRTPLAQ